MNKILIYLLTPLVAFGVGFGGTYLVKSLFGNDGGKEPAEPVKQEERTEVTVEPEETPAETVTELPSAETGIKSAAETGIRPEAETGIKTAAETRSAAPAVFALDKSAVKVRAESGGDTFTVTGLGVTGDSGAGARYVLTDSENHVYRSDDGSFSGVAANTKGVYAVAAYDKITNEKSKVLTISGFKSKNAAPAQSSQVDPVTRLTASELAGILNTGDSDNLNGVRDRIVPRNCRVTCNLPGVSTLSEVFTKVNMEGKKASVSNVKYDPYGRVSALTVNLD